MSGQPIIFDFTVSIGGMTAPIARATLDSAGEQDSDLLGLQLDEGIPVFVRSMSSAIADQIGKALLMDAKTDAGFLPSITLADYLPKDEPFFLTYGDGVADIDIGALLDFHKAHGKQATVSAVSPPGRFGALEIVEGAVKRFIEKPPGDNGLINGGFFVLEPSVIDRIAGESTVWELEPLEGLARDGQLMARPHDGFWAAMDTLRDKNTLEALWTSGEAPWKLWK